MLSQPNTSIHARGNSSRDPFGAIAAVYHSAANSNRTLWSVQTLLAALFVFAGVSKLVMPASTLDEQSDLPVMFMRFIGVCEALGAAGLILPGAFRIRTDLTPLAGAGLVVIMVGAVVVSAAVVGVAAAVPPLVVGLALTFVVTARSRRSC